MGSERAYPIVLEMCPSVRQSCCSKRDQLDIYANWIHSKEGINVKHHFFETTTTYIKLLDNFKNVKNLALKIKNKLIEKKKDIANCKVLAERILVFEIDKLISKIKQNLRKMEDFFYDTYKGFYCGVCNYENHKFVEEDKLTITYSEKFCRDIIENTLASLLFLHVHLNKYANLVSKFLLSCDYKGDYQIDVSIPKKYLFISDELNEKNLIGCRNERNNKSWFVYCRPICEKFKFATYSDFFEPEIKKIKLYTEFLHNKTAEINHGGKGRVLFNNLLKPQKKERILSSRSKKGRILSKKLLKDDKKKKERKLMDRDAANEEKNKSKKGL